MQTMPERSLDFDDERKAQLEHANAELSRSNQELEQFAYVASHDLKSPLVVIEGFLDLLVRTKADQLDDDASMYIAAAQRGAERMGRLIDDLLAYSRVGRYDCKREYVDAASLVEQVLAERSTEVEKARAAVFVGNLPTVHGYPTMLRQLFDNLISNALKFRRETGQVVVEIDAVEIDGACVFRVTDNGVGVPAKDRESVFTMFTRLGHTLDRGGSGIGLATCQRVVQLHGGRIWFADGYDGGAQACFTLPD
jgi:signal transduction histidine kinase